MLTAAPATAGPFLLKNPVPALRAKPRAPITRSQRRGPRGCAFQPAPHNLTIGRGPCDLKTGLVAGSYSFFVHHYDICIVRTSSVHAGIEPLVELLYTWDSNLCESYLLTKKIVS
jgi:hypothetical protein